MRKEEKKIKLFKYHYSFLRIARLRIKVRIYNFMYLIKVQFYKIRKINL